jgi:hypothetical protein
MHINLCTICLGLTDGRASDIIRSLQAVGVTASQSVAALPSSLQKIVGAFQMVSAAFDKEAALKSSLGTAHGAAGEPCRTTIHQLALCATALPRRDLGQTAV